MCSSYEYWLKYVCKYSVRQYTSYILQYIFACITRSSCPLQYALDINTLKSFQYRIITVFYIAYIVLYEVNFLIRSMKAMNSCSSKKIKLNYINKNSSQHE